MPNAEQRFAIEDLLVAHGQMIDADELEGWLDLFVEDAEYQIVPRENWELGYPLTLMLCENKNMIRDRVLSLRKANVYNIHYDRHVIGGIRYLGQSNDSAADTSDDLIEIEASYAVFQTDQEGVSRLFSVGRYVDRIVFTADGPKFRKKTVIADTASVPTLLATPI